MRYTSGAPSLMRDVRQHRSGGASVTVVSLDESKLDLAAAALGRAFQDDPLQSYVFPDPVARERLSPDHFRPVLRYGIRYGEVLTTPGVPVGAAVWLPPGQTSVTDERAAETGLDRLASTIGADAANRFFSVLGFIDPFHHQDAPDPHWYTMIIGVEPSAQGRGCGRSLLQPILDRAENAGQACYLETAQPDNIAFYRHLGFRVLREVKEPSSGLRLWTLRRDGP